MKTYFVKVTLSTTVSFQMECDDKSDVWTTARQKAHEHVLISDLRAGSVDAVQLGEPWIDSCGWFDLHEPGDVFCFNRALGNQFCPSDIQLLTKRLATLGFRVVDSWNTNSGCVSFRCEGRIGTDQITSEQRAMLEAPR